MRSLLSSFAISFLFVSPTFGQVPYRGLPVALDDADPPTISIPGEAIPGTEGIVIGDGVVLDDFDLRGAALSGVANASLRGTNLLRADLWDLPSGDFTGANLEGAVLSGDLSQGDFTGANFADAILRGNSVFDAARFHEANFMGASISGRYLHASFRNASFTSGTRLNGSFAGADFAGVDFEHSTMEGSFQHAVFHGADLTGASFVRQLRGVDAYLGADFSEANLSGLRISQAGFANASFRGANLSDVFFDNDVRFFGNDFRQANFKNARFKGSDLAFADVRQVDFTTMSGPEIGLVGAKYDQFTIFPWTDFDPVAAGMEFVPARHGDTNLDDELSFEDFFVLSNNFGARCEDDDLACWKRGDFNLDGAVGFTDFLLQANNFKTEHAVAVPAPKTPRFILAWPLLAVAFQRSKREAK